MAKVNLDNVDSSRFVEAKIFAIKADYRKNNPNKPTYYVMATDKKQAKSKFKEHISWLDIYEVEEVPKEKYSEIKNSYLEQKLILF